MSIQDNVYSKIAIKYSAVPILTEDDVANFYLNLGYDFSPDDVEVIIADLTHEIDNNSSKDEYSEYDGGDEYPQDGDNQLDFFEKVY